MEKAIVYVVTFVTVLLILAAPPSSALYSNPFYVLLLICLWILVSAAILHAIYDDSHDD